MNVRAIAWKANSLELLDQTLLPGKLRFLRLSRVEQIYEAIQSLRVRGAPAIGITAAYGLYLALREKQPASPKSFFKELDRAIKLLASARPTAVNLAWALHEARSRLLLLKSPPVAQLKCRLLAIAKELHKDDRDRCERMAEHGQAVIPKRARILTHCNTGALATGGIGTAFGVIHKAHELGKNIHVLADETRPVLQGARLTALELAAAGISYELICDNAAAALMSQGKVDLVILGADRIAADGSTANKIGTYSVAVLAKYHHIPFYVAAPLSTFDLAIASGRDIPIEARSEEEVRRVFGKVLITLAKARCQNPAFDVTPPELITAFVTERGIIRPPFARKIRKLASNP